MNRQQFIGYLKDPRLLDAESTNQIENLVKEYPYCQSAGILLTLGLYKENNIKFSNQLKNASACVSDRKLLKQRLHSLKEDAGGKDFQQREIDNKPTDRKHPDFSDPHLSELLNLLHNEVNELLIRTSQSESSQQQTATLKNISENLEKLVERKESKEKSNVTTDSFIDSLSSSYTLEETGDVHIKQSNLSTNEALIDKFIQEEPKIVPKLKTEFFDPMDLARQSLIDNEDIVTETLAEIYYKQGNLAKAIKIYKKLSLANPKKSSYFAARIEKIQKEIK